MTRSYPERNPVSIYALTLREARLLGSGPLVFVKFRETPSGLVEVAATVRVRLLGIGQQFMNSPHEVAFLDRKLPTEMTWDASPTGERWMYEFYELGLQPRMMGRRGAEWAGLPCLVKPENASRLVHQFPKPDPW